MSVERGTRTRLATVFILFLVLVAGAVLGVALDRMVIGQDIAALESAGEGAAEGASGSRRGQSPSQRRLIVEQVGLSEMQKTQVDSIVSHYRQEMRVLAEELKEREDELREAYFPRYRDLLDGTREEIKGVLTPAQRMEYDSLLAEHDRRIEERRNRPSDSVRRNRPE